MDNQYLTPPFSILYKGNTGLPEGTRISEFVDSAIESIDQLLTDKDREALGFGKPG